LNLLGILSSSMEVYEGFRIETTPDRTLHPLKHGVSGWVTRIGGVLSGPVPLALRLLGWRSPKLRRWAAISGIAGSLCTRYGWMAAGRASAADWRLPLEIPEKARAVEQFPERVPERIREAEQPAFGVSRQRAR
jgi:hypothetical protein